LNTQITDNYALFAKFAQHLITLQHLSVTCGNEM